MLRSEFRDIRYDIRIKRCSVRLYLKLFVGGLMSYLCYLCLLAHSGVQHILCCVFLFCLSSSVYPCVAVSLKCPFLIAPWYSLSFIYTDNGIVWYAN